MTDIERLGPLRRYFHTGEIPIATPHCLEAETVGALADGTLGADARAHALAHLATCAFCRQAVASVAAALADGPITHEIAVAEGRVGWRRRLLIAMPIAAAALLVVMLGRNTSDQPGSPVLRDSVVTDTTALAPAPIAPRGSVLRVNRFVWSSVPRVQRYRLRLYNEEGDVLWTTETADTVVTMPDSIDLLPRATYLWKVEAQTEWQRWAASDLVEFRLGGPSR